ncbi:hypothetical protein BH09VER1_BH09VER1_27950 [soil metagenome]
MHMLAAPPHPQQLVRRLKDSTRAFSLVEVVLAIGIVSFAMVSILGLIPVGLHTFRSAMDLSVEAGIAQKLVADVQRTDFQNLQSTNFCFDDQGIPVAPAGAVFTAQVAQPQALAADGIMQSNASAWTVLIKISNRMNPSLTNSYPVVVSRGF